MMSIKAIDEDSTNESVIRSVENHFMDADPVFEIQNRETIAQYGQYANEVFRKGSNLYSLPPSSDRKSTIKSKERKKRTLKKKNAKRSRKRNKK